MTAIHKQPLRIDDSEQVVRGWPIHVGLDPSGQPCVWYESSPEHPHQSLRVVGTGHLVPTGWLHVGSFINPPLFVWHIYRRPTPTERRSR